MTPKIEETLCVAYDRLVKLFERCEDPEHARIVGDRIDCLGSVLGTFGDRRQPLYEVGKFPIDSPFIKDMARARGFRSVAEMLEESAPSAPPSADPPPASDTPVEGAAASPAPETASPEPAEDLHGVNWVHAPGCPADGGTPPGHGGCLCSDALVPITGVTVKGLDHWTHGPDCPASPAQPPGTGNCTCPVQRGVIEPAIINNDGSIG